MDISAELWASFAFYVAILMAKFLAMSFLTARQRFSNKVNINCFVSK